VSYAQIELKLQSRRKILILTTKSALDNQMILEIQHFRFISFKKAIPYLFLSLVKQIENMPN